jgi:hypothetical protein
LRNCTVTGNSENGVYGCTLYNSIVYYNMINYVTCILNYCCTTPLPTDGIGNISLDPQLVSASHLSATSACRATGNTAYAAGTDIDSEAWGNPPSIGCDEYYSGATGMLQTSIIADYTNVAAGFIVNLSGSILGHTASNRWDFGDGTSVSAVVYPPLVSHAWTKAGSFVVTLTAYNETYPAGVSNSLVVHVVAQPVHYVSLINTNPVSPYNSWATAATSIQDAVDAATLPGSLVLVTNGIYGTGGSPGSTYRVLVVKPVLLSSVNGPQFTVVDGGSEVGCVYLVGGTFLSGFTLTNGIADSGGGVWSEMSAVVSNCVLTGNSASYGGGAYGGTLNNCTLMANSATFDGGGARESTLNNCTLNGNQAASGGGISGGTLVSCTLNGNLAAQSGGGAENCTLKNCILNANSAGSGGGAYGGTLNNCTLMANSATFDGGGAAYFSRLNGCTLSGNFAAFGGGASGGILNNCTLTSNSATNSGGGTSGSTLNNCIVYFNAAKHAANYDSDSVLNFCCATPLPPGTGNISADPKLTDSAHLSASSPCVAAGSADFISGVDIDGESWQTHRPSGATSFTRVP